MAGILAGGCVGSVNYDNCCQSAGQHRWRHRVDRHFEGAEDFEVILPEKFSCVETKEAAIMPPFLLCSISWPQP
jgi:hypothetical protein